VTRIDAGECGDALSVPQQMQGLGRPQLRVAKGKQLWFLVDVRREGRWLLGYADPHARSVPSYR
jgi:hypothetical protein